jgi:hypothetical protein
MSGEAFAWAASLTGLFGNGDQSSFRIMPIPRLFVTSELPVRRLLGRTPPAAVLDPRLTSGRGPLPGTLSRHDQ